MVNLEKLDMLVSEYSAFSDNPWGLLYELLDNRYPNSKFILFYRNTDKWYHSMVKYFGKANSSLRQIIYHGYGSPIGDDNEVVYKSVYEKHNNDVIEYFKEKDNLLVIKLDEELDITNKLNQFLGFHNSVQFPKSNKS